ncbi:MAG: hypothetical protein ABSF29_14780 [Tepidisphaeraceae bacterium]|jgi:hypothetical protein
MGIVSTETSIMGRTIRQIEHDVGRLGASLVDCDEAKEQELAELLCDLASLVREQGETIRVQAEQLKNLRALVERSRFPARPAEVRS